MKNTAKRRWQQENSVSEFIPYSVQVDENTVKLKSGDFMQILKLDGRAHESADPEDIIIWKEQINNLLKNICSPQLSLWVNIVRRESGEYPTGEYQPGTFSEHLNNKYKTHVTKNKMMVNELYLSVVYRPTVTKAEGLFQRLEKNKDVIERNRIEALEKLRNIVTMISNSLGAYGARLLGCYDRNGVKHSEVLEFLSFLINLEWIPRALPRQPLSEALPHNRPFFGADAYEIRGMTDSHMGACLGISEYPTGTEAGLLNAFLSAPFNLVLTQSFNFLSKKVAIELLSRAQRRMVNSGDLSQSQIDELDDALDDLQSGRIVMGEHHLVMNVMAKDAHSLKNNLNAAWAELVDCSMVATREDWAIEAAFWSQLPGNFKYRPRPSPIHSRNFAGFSSFHNYPTGNRRGNQWGPAVTMLKTSSDAPYYFNFHEELDGRKAKKLAEIEASKGADAITEKLEEGKALGNTLLIGPSGSGKTVLQGFMMSQSRKFNPTQVIFDKDRGLEIYVRSERGVYFPLQNGVKTGFNPFQMEPSEDLVMFLTDLVKICAGGEISTPEESDIDSTIRSVLRLPFHRRRLGTVLNYLDKTNQHGVHARLAKWCGDGALAWVFDNAEDNLDLSKGNIFGFDVTDFLDNPEVRTPIVMYLFQRINKLMDGRRLQIFMDEFWKLLLDDYFSSFAEDKLKTIRKLNGIMVFGTQSAKDVHRSPIAHSIIEQCPTIIAFPNQKARHEDFVEKLSFSEREYQLIKEELMPNSRRFLIKQGVKSVVAELDLSGFDDELAIISGTPANVALMTDAITEVGDDPDKWIPVFHKKRRFA